MQRNPRKRPVAIGTTPGEDPLLLDRSILRERLGAPFETIGDSRRLTESHA